MGTLTKAQKKALATLPGAVIETDASKGFDSAIIYFDRTAPDYVTIKKDDVEKTYPLNRVTFRMISCQKCFTSVKNEKYVKADKEEDGEETYTCVVLLHDMRENLYQFGTMLLRKSLTKITAHVRDYEEEVIKLLKSQGNEEFKQKSYLAMRWRPEMKTVSNDNGSYLKVSSVEFLDFDEAEAWNCVDEITENIEAFTAAKEAAESWL